MGKPATIVESPVSSSNASVNCAAVKIRVLAIVPSSFCYGLQNVTLSVFSRLSPGIKPYFLNSRWNDGEFPRRVAKLGFEQSSTWLGMFSRKLDWHNLRMTLECLIKLPIAWYDFTMLYRNFRPQVIYLANHHEIILLSPLLLFVRHKVICHMHDPSPDILFQRLSFAFWNKAVGQFIYISESVRQRTFKLGRAAARGTVIHNGVRVHGLALPRERGNRFAQQFGWLDDVVIVGISGQMTRTKGHEDLIAAAALAHERAPSLRFVIAGKPLEPFYAELKAKIAAEGLISICTFAGWLPTAQEFYENIDIFVLASRHDEGFGLVVAEAMERGCAVLATRSGGASEIVEDGISGWLVAKQAPLEIAERLVALAFDPECRMRVGISGRERIAAYFDLDDKVRQFEAFLGNAAAIHSASGNAE